MDNTLGSLFPPVEPKMPSPAAPSSKAQDADDGPSNGAFMQELTRAQDSGSKGGQLDRSPRDKNQPSRMSGTPMDAVDSTPDAAGSQAAGNKVPANSMAMIDPAWQDQIAAAQLPAGMGMNPAMMRAANEIRAMLKGVDPGALMNNAAIALLTGKLDRIDPASIPTIVAKTPFLQEAMAAPDMAQFMDMPMRLGDILKGLRIDPEQIAGLAPNSLDRMVSANEVIKALGLDPQRVRCELTTLQESLPVDGVSPYMVRAAALRGSKKGAGKDKSALDQVDPNAASGRNNLRRDPKDDAMAMMLAAGVAGQQGMNPAVQGQSARPTPDLQGPQGMPFGQAPIASAPQAGMGAGTREAMPADMMTAAAMANMEPVTPAAPDSAVMNALSGGSAKGASNAAPTGLKAGGAPAQVDPFAGMTNDMNAASDVATTRYAPEAVSQQPSATDVLREQMLRQTKPAASPAATVPAAQAAVVPGDAVPVGHDRGLQSADTGGRDVSQINRLMMEASAPGGSVTKSTGRLTARGVTAVGAAASTTGERDAAGPAAAGVDQNNDPQQVDSAVAGAGIHGQKTDFSRKLEEAQQPRHSSETVRPEVVKDVFEKAHMMVRDGGGSMRIDLPTPWGKVDLAVRVDRGNVQIRMLSDAPQVRDALNQDLSRLRDALAGQNLNLGSVEVGVGGGNAWAQNFGQGGFEAGRNLEDLREFQTAAGDRVSQARRQATRTIERVGTGPRISRADGHIEVLV